MQLYLVRHGEPMTEREDPRRPLSEKGRADVERVSAMLPELGNMTIYHSGKDRALETAEILGNVLVADVVEHDGLKPMDDPSVWAGRIDESKDDLMLVGHLPFMGRLAAMLLCGDSGNAFSAFEAGTVMCLSREGTQWYLRWMVTPSLGG